MKNKSFSSREKLMKKLIKDPSKPESLMDLLKLKAEKPIILNPRILRKEKSCDGSANKLAFKGLLLIDETNRKNKRKQIIYDKMKQENELFLEQFKKVKSMTDRNKFEKSKKFRFIFEELLNAYKLKGMNLDRQFLLKCIFNKSGILLRDRELIDEYFSEEFQKGGEQSLKILKYKSFMNKLLTDTNKRLILKLPFLNTEKFKMLQNQNNENSFLEENMKTFYKRQMEIEKLISENELLQKLIEIDNENFLKEKSSKENDEKNNEKDNNFLVSSSFSESSSSYNIIGNKIINRKEEENISIDKKSIHNNNINNISTIKKKENKKEHKNRSDNAIHPHIFRTIYNENDNEINSITLKNRKSSKTVSNLPDIKINKDKKKKAVTFTSGIFSSSIMRTIESGLFKTRLKNKVDEENKEIFHPLQKTKNKRKANLRNNIYSLHNSTKSIMTSQIEKNSKSQPNLSSVEDTYKKILKYDTSSQSKTLTKILRNIYGNNIKGIKIKKNARSLLNFFYKIRENIKDSEKKDYIYKKYRGTLPDELDKKIFLKKNLNEKLKNRVIYYAKNYCNTLNILVKNK